MPLTGNQKESMKKLTLKKLVKRRKKTPEVPTRITNDTVAEHRERILAGGRRYKYPVQYARHKLVLNALLIVTVSVIVLVLLVWWQLYLAQSSNSLMYRVTRIFPLPVAQVDGEPVRYSDYLSQYRASEYYLSKYGDIKVDSESGRSQLAYIKRQSLNRAEADAYAEKLAKEYGVTVSEKDVDAVIDQQRNTANGRISQETYDASSRMMYDWSPEDYRLAVKRSILRARVAFEVDKSADELQQKAARLIRETGGDLERVAAELDTGLPQGRVQVATSGLVYNTSTSGGLIVSEVAKLEQGGVSGAMRSTTDSGYYFVKVLEKNDKQVNFQYLHIPLTEFKAQFEKLRSDNKIKEFISVPEVEQPQGAN